VGPVETSNMEQSRRTDRRTGISPARAHMTLSTEIRPQQARGICRSEADHAHAGSRPARLVTRPPAWAACLPLADKPGERGAFCGWEMCAVETWEFDGVCLRFGSGELAFWGEGRWRFSRARGGEMRRPMRAEHFRKSGERRVQGVTSERQWGRRRGWPVS
jgi:hypothetical protein